ncbi:hypothetical protein L596_023680 [Steinernema carpocapsae]|uniref:Uncharacterized protein n=1 Tax=Steinernema carpocapsae TaxID=34508 RepID=A0A4U5MEC8_STECR|nr:hypothetical protein L596_023680 [Steinernema carpocapsae]
MQLLPVALSFKTEGRAKTKCEVDLSETNNKRLWSDPKLRFQLHQNGFHTVKYSFSKHDSIQKKAFEVLRGAVDLLALLLDLLALVVSFRVRLQVEDFDVGF